MASDLSSKTVTQFNDYYNNDDSIFQKDSCPNCCDYKNMKKTPIVGIPEPQNHKFFGVLVSEDPTTDFIGRYLDARTEGKDDRIKWRLPLISKDVPPVWLIERLYEVNKKRWNGECITEIKLLNDTIQNNFYWTHMLKCCTMKNHKLKVLPAEERITRAFTRHRGVICADNWLAGELSWAISHGAKCIVTLGKSPEIWSQKWRNENPTPEDVILINLPHPSPINRYSWSPDTPDKIDCLDESIAKLFRLSHNMSFAGSGLEG